MSGYFKRISGMFFLSLSVCTHLLVRRICFLNHPKTFNFSVTDNSKSEIHGRVNPLTLTLQNISTWGMISEKFPCSSIIFVIYISEKQI